MIKYFFIITILIAGCASIENETPKGEFFVSILMTEGAHRGPVHKKEGFEFYIEEPLSNTLGPFLNGYRYKNGRLVEDFDQGSSGGDFVREIQAIGFEPFDYELELELSKAEEAARKDYPILGGSRDGAKWELRIITNEGEFYLHEWNPGGEIELLSPYSENFEKLDKLIKVLERYYGSYHLHM